ncbi:MAG: TIGR03790 family protein, partial [Gammaproteobacteria bacterium]|nr:TIGR03790 family protein [Gammaproteobacteria bacterium]
MRCFTLLPTVFLITALLVPLTGSAEPQPDAENPSLGPRELAVIVNDADPLSRRIGEYYRVSRKIPIENVIHIAFPPRRDQIPPWEFERLKRMVDAQTPRHVQAFVLTWTSPYRVGCMSITTAFAAGFDPAFCAQGCARTLISPYFNST